jgi:hypothetical protein
VKRWYLQFSKVLLLSSMALMSGRFSALAQQAKPVKVLFLLDGSSSMLDDWQPGTQRFTAASGLINTIIDSIRAVNPNVEFGLRVFGHQYPVQQNICTDTKLEVPFSKGNQAQIKARLKYISARGVSPIAYSLQKTAEENFINSDRVAYSIILLTDGGESCGGNLCDVIAKLLGGKITFTPYILSLIDNMDLKKEYDCLGKYLTVAAPAQVGPAIKTIIDDNRQMYITNDGTFAVTKHELPKAAPTVEPSAKPVPIPAKIDTPKVVESPVAAPRSIIIALSDDKRRPLRRLPFKKINSTPKQHKPLAPSAKILFTQEDPVVVPPEQPKPRPKVAIIGAKRTDIRWTTIRVLPSDRRIKQKPLFVSKLQFTEDEPRQIAVAQPQPKPVPTPKPQPAPKPQTQLPFQKQEEAKVKTVTERSEDTKVLVYFTDGKGKYYKTEPKIDFVDVKSNKVVQSNFRLVDRRTGIPEPIKIAPGTYRITRPNSSFKTAIVTIEPNTTQRIDITIAKGSIKFRYSTNPNRPMIEYSATVQNYVEKGPMVRQRCDELLEYEPGIYHIEINTLPISVRTLPDLKFGELNIIDIPEPGTFAVTNSFRGKVQLWYLKGAAYEPFYDFDLNGNPADQKLDLQPGSYKVFFFKDGKEQEQEFKIKSNAVSSVTL